MNSVWRAQLPQSSPMSPKTPGRKAPSGNLALFWRFLSLYLAKWNIYNGFLYLYSEQPHTNFVMFLSQAHCLEFAKGSETIFGQNKSDFVQYRILRCLPRVLCLLLICLLLCSPYQLLPSLKFEPKLSTNKKQRNPKIQHIIKEFFFFLQINHFWKVWKENERKN